MQQNIASGDAYEKDISPIRRIKKKYMFVFTSLDMDLYQSMKAGLFYFGPKIVRGGVIFIHDFNN